MTVGEVKVQLQALAEPEYQRFNASLLPGVTNVLGVRMPALRKLSKEIARGDWAAYLAEADEETHEETVLQGLVIALAKAPLQTMLPYIAAHVEKLSNWANCDIFCGDLKAVREAPDVFWSFLQPYFEREEPYPRRFAIVAASFFFLDDEHVDRVLALLDQTVHPDYYVRMAVAWALSMAYVAHPDRTMAYLSNSALDDWTYNKALQKIIESRQVDDSVRQLMRSMKRKGASKA